jgi:pimeloyl-ACP methyl ester carboxylesterase/DNA-binding CsgD family transcriptional regulator
MEDLDGDGSADLNAHRERSGHGDCPTARDRLVRAIYEAASDPDAYGGFVSALSSYLEDTAVKSWNIVDLSEVDIGVVEADSGLAMHLDNLNRKLSEAWSRKPPGSLRERVAHASGVAVAIDRTGGFAALSPAARKMLGEGDGGIETLAQSLHAEDAMHLREAVTEHVVRGHPVSTRILRGEAIHLIARTLWSDADGKDYLCLDALTVNWSSELETVLETSFRLTPAEMRVVERLVAGETVRDIATRFKRAEGTVRNQIKSILAKTEAGGIANLNRIVALIADNMAAAPTLLTTARGTSGDLEVLTLPDGRAIEVRQQGPMDGRPVLFIHGMLFGSELPGTALTLLHDAGIRLIAPARPSFGLSDPSPRAPSEEPDRLVEDLLFVLDRYGVERSICLTNIAGAVYGYALASAAPDRVSGLVHAASIIPILKAGQFVSMPPTQRLISFLMRFVPEYLPPLLRSGIAQIRASGEIPFLATLYEAGTCDHAVATRPDLFDLMVRSVHFATDQGYLTAYTDTLQIVRDWTHYVDRVSAHGIRSIHVHGRQDPQYPFEDVARFTGRFETLELRGVEDAGQLVLFDRPDEIIAAVSELLL